MTSVTQPVEQQLASAIFEWIEAWYNPRRRHTSLGDLSPIEFEALHTTEAPQAGLPQMVSTRRAGSGL